MAKSIDQQFVKKVQNLVQEVLSDEARFVSRNEQSLVTLHNHVFSKASEMPFKNMEEKDQAFFKKYFYLNNNINTPRQDVAFTDSIDEQAFFFDQFRRQVKFCTFGYDRLDFLRPTFSDEKAVTPTFNADQSVLLVRGVVLPLLHSVEQREIALLEQKKSGKVAEDADQNAENPYNQLADKVLVKSNSGQFDAVLTYAQLEEIASQEDQLRKQGLEQGQVVKLLQEYIIKRFPDLNLYLTPEGKIITFLSAAGVSASNLEQPPFGGQPGGSPSGQSADGAVSFADLVKEMKFRQARKMQYAALIAAKGNLGFSPSNFQVAGGGVVATINGLTVQLDQGGQGNNAVFFLIDRQGVATKVIIDTASYRIDGKPEFNFSLYEKPEVDSPASPKMKVKHEDLPRLKTPLLALYSQLQQPGQFTPTPEKIEFKKPPTAVPMPPLNVPVTPGGPGGPSFPGAVLPGQGEISISPPGGPGPAIKKPLEMTMPGAPLAVGPQKSGPVTKKVMPKIPAGSAALPPQPVIATGELPTQVGQPQAAGPQPKVAAGVSPQPAAGKASKSKSPWPQVALVAGATGLPIIGTIAGGVVNLFIK